MPRNQNSITTVEQEFDYMNKVWNKLETLEKVVILTVAFFYFYFVIIVLASYNNLSKSSEPTAGKIIFGLILTTATITFAPMISHYLGISTFGVIHIIGFAGVLSFVAALWLLFETYDKRELDSSTYKDPYSMAIYFLLISFSVIYVINGISRKF